MGQPLARHESRESPRSLAPLHPILYEPVVRKALEEDLGQAGDITTDAVVPIHARATARLIARVEGTVAGVAVAACAFRMLDAAASVDPLRHDGERVGGGEAVLSVEGPARVLLTAERVALNFLGRLSGVATATARLVAAIEGFPARVTSTRKTTPGLRALEKYAVRAGGGIDHRFGLDDGVLIKDNHLLVAGTITKAVERVRNLAGHMVKVQVEVDTLAQLEEALSCPIDAVLLDNMSPETLRRAVRMVAGRLITEASGGITLENCREVAASGVNLLSVGWLTHSAPALDVAMEIVEIRESI